MAKVRKKHLHFLMIAIKINKEKGINIQKPEIYAEGI